MQEKDGINYGIRIEVIVVTRGGVQTPQFRRNTITLLLFTFYYAHLRNF